MTMPFVFPGLPTRVVFGHGTLAQVADEVARLSRSRALVLSTSNQEDEARNLDETAMTWMGMVADSTSMPGMASEDELDALIASSGDAADELFVELMTEHHVGGIEMAEFASEQAANEEVQLMAASMASAQRGEIAEMAGLID